MILREIDLHVSPGEYGVLLGPNGAGKSTLLKVLVLLLKPSAGLVKVNGQAGFLSHRSFLYDRLTPWENLTFYGSLFQVPHLADRIEKITAQVGLSHFLHDPVSTFSRGMVQRLAIARAVLHDPEILFLDEPFTGLDQNGAGILNGVLADLRSRGKTVLLVTHHFDQGLDLADRILIMKDGAKIFDEKIHRSSSPDLKQIYLDQVGME